LDGSYQNGNDRRVMEPIRKRILELIEARDPELNLKKVSLALGRNHAYLQQYIQRGTPKNLPEHERKLLAGILGIDESELRATVETVSSGVTPVIDTDKRHITKYPVPPPGDRDLPVLGIAVCGTEGFFMMNGEVHEWFPRPEQLRAVTNAYAVYVVDSSMEPVLYEGQVAYVHPTRHLTTPCLVLVELHDETAMIKQFVKRTPTKLIVRQFNPPRDIEVVLGQVKAAHRIVLTGDAP